MKRFHCLEGVLYSTINKEENKMKQKSKRVLLTLLVIIGMITLMGCEKKDAKKEVVNVVGMKGPTTMGLVSLMNENEQGKSQQNYNISMVTTPEEVSAMLASKKADIGLVPANLAAVLYQKTNQEVVMIDINTLGVLYVVSKDASINSVGDLAGKTIYMTGKGTSPDYVLQYLLKANGVDPDEVTIEYKAEPTEIVSLLKENENVVAVLPQPFATVAVSTVDQLDLRLDLTKEWNQIHNGESQLVTGVTIVRKEFLESYEGQVELFMKEHKQSAEYANANIEETSKLVTFYQIIEKEKIAQKALPFCNITYLDKDEMKKAVEGYYGVLFEQDPKSIGGQMPDSDFYYGAKK